MRRTRKRARSTAEIAFLIMRALAYARLLWRRDGALPLDALPALLAAPGAAIGAAIERLSEEGVCEVDVAASTIRLTEPAARDIFRRAGAPAPALPSAAGL